MKRKSMIYFLIAMLMMGSLVSETLLRSSAAGEAEPRSPSHTTPAPHPYKRRPP